MWGGGSHLLLCGGLQLFLPFPRDLWRAATEGERDSHYPAALYEADAGAWWGWEGSVQEEFLECTLPVRDSSQVFYVGKCLELGLSFLPCDQVCLVRLAVGSSAFHSQLL